LASLRRFALAVGAKNKQRGFGHGVMSDSNVLVVLANEGVICAMIGNPETVAAERHDWITSDLHTVTRAMKRQAVEDLVVIFVVCAQL
jgi:hypothetical protein